MARGLKATPTHVRCAFIVSVVCGFLCHGSCAELSEKQPWMLKTDSLVNPIGIDSQRPLFSWQLNDPRRGARQTAYQVQVFSTPTLFTDDRPDVWDSGKIVSDHSLGVAYGGPGLSPEHRYYWRVKVWDQYGHPYPVSKVQWWETGLLSADRWRAEWIGLESTWHRRLRGSGAMWITNRPTPNLKVSGDTQHDFRIAFGIENKVAHADLFVTGQDTAAAWLNGDQVLSAQPFPPGKHIAWKTYTRQDVTANLRPGRNLLAIQVTLYDGDKTPSADIAPMSGCLLIEMVDGSTLIVSSDDKWKADLNAPAGWQESQFDDSKWQNAISYASASAGTDTGIPWPTDSAVILRHEFQMDSRVVSARLYITALGLYECHINGRRIGDQVLAPGWTDYRTRVFYQVYDVTSYLKIGRNAISAFLAPGWYAGPLKWEGQGNNYGVTPPALRAQLRVTRSDGSVEWITSDSTWKADVSPILKAEIYDGEIYDARLEQPGWDLPGFDDRKWRSAELVNPQEPTILAQDFEPIRVEKSLAAVKITSPKPGVTIYDFGQNVAGVARLAVSAPAGTDLRLRFGEVLNPDGSLYVDNLRSAKATDHYIVAGKGVEEFQPAFTYHGFRYAELSGLPVGLARATVHAVVFHTDAALTATLRTGSPMVNRLWSNILWTQKANFMSIPTDCPQRDERLGWGGDAHIFWRTASYNMDLIQFAKKYAADLRETQRGTAMFGQYAPGTDEPNSGMATGWSDAGIIVPWTAWIQSGDVSIVSQNWNAMQRYLAAVESANPTYLWENGFGGAYGDWLAPEGPTRETLLTTAYWAYDVSLMRQMAHALGKTADEQKYAELFAKIKAVFAKAYIEPDGLIRGAAHLSQVFPQLEVYQASATRDQDTETGYVLALYMGLVPDSLHDAVANRLVDEIDASQWRVTTGIQGTAYLLEALSDAGYSDRAYRLLMSRQYPSWGYMIDHGATTVWERWNGNQMRGDAEMNSYNHYALGAVGAWIYRYAAGIDTISSDPGFHTIYLHPNFDSRIGRLNFSYDSPYGRINSGWSVRDGMAHWAVTIPANATGQLVLTKTQVAAYRLNGNSLAQSHDAKLVRSADSHFTYQLAAGTYSFLVRMREGGQP